MPAHDPIKSATTQIAIRAATAKLTPITLRRLREDLSRFELGLIEEMVSAGVDASRVTALSHCSRAIETIDQLKGTRERPRRE